MSSNSFALKVIGIEFLAILLSGALVLFYVKSVNERHQNATAANAQSFAPKPSANMQTFAASYKRDGKSVTELLSALKLRQEADLITFVIDTSQSMDDDRQELKENVKKLVAHYRGKSFELISFTDTAQVMGAPTRDPVELQRKLDQAHDLGGPENTYRALMTAADKAREQFKNPVIILMTDAAPNDGMPGSSSNITLDQAANAVNSANAEFYVFAAFDEQEEMSGGSAATSPFYPQLVGKIKAGGQVYYLKRDNFDPNAMRPSTGR